MTKRVGIFGGTFDPIHCAHLILAEHAWEQFQLDTILMMPCAVPPHKEDRAAVWCSLQLKIIIILNCQILR